ncbi:hypothetical protein HDU99_003517, partial [Rhizoclosmatium hyalinum]
SLLQDLDDSVLPPPSKKAKKDKDRGSRDFMSNWLKVLPAFGPKPEETHVDQDDVQEVQTQPTASDDTTAGPILNATAIFDCPTIPHPDDCPLEQIKVDPAKRVAISSYPNHVQKEVLRRYLLQGPTVIKREQWPKGTGGRKFNNNHYNDRGWLEMSESEYSLYCWYCFCWAHENDYGFKGTSNWKCLTGVNGILAKHERSEAHQLAAAKYLGWKLDPNDPLRIDNVMRGHMCEE